MVLNRKKTFDIRANDRGYQTGDLVQFTVVNDSGLKMSDRLNDTLWQITCVLYGWGLKEGYCVFCFEPYIEPKNKHELNDADLLELRDRFGEGVAYVVEDMLSDKGERWRVGKAEN